VYGEHLRRLFPDLHPVPEDLCLLETHQVEMLPQRGSAPDLAALLHANPAVRHHLATRHPPLRAWFEALLRQHPPLAGASLAAAQDRVLWEVADEIVYQREPDAYDAVAARDLDLGAITDVAILEGTTVIDAGAGTGVVAFAVLPHARRVFAVEPVAALRAWMRRKAARTGATNLYVLDGTLDAIPLPPSIADVLVTSRAVGWRPGDEISEVERILGAGGLAVHLTGMPHPAPEGDPLHAGLVSAGYTADAYGAGEDRKRRYWRRFSAGGPEGRSAG
jgi:SAM-dependent methyltransferase